MATNNACASAPACGNTVACGHQSTGCGQVECIRCIYIHLLLALCTAKHAIIQIQSATALSRHDYDMDNIHGPQLLQ